VTSNPKETQTDFTRLPTLFQGTLKTAASRHKCGDNLPQNKIMLLLDHFKLKIQSFPFALVARVSKKVKFWG
jgi:hypothetical protein